MAMLDPPPTLGRQVLLRFVTRGEDGSMPDISLPGFNFERLTVGPSDRNPPFAYRRRGEGEINDTFVGTWLGT